MPQMEFDFDGLIQLLAHHLYSDKKVFLRELIQNAHDAIVRRSRVDSVDYGGRIDILSRAADLQIIVRDNGIGMSRGDLEEYLSSIGRSLTRLQKQDVEGLIGQFGIGFLSAFVVARRVEVRTRKLGEEQGWLWENEGSRQYQVTPCTVSAPGTTITIHLRGEDYKGVAHPQELRRTIRHYADMLRVPIYVDDGASPVNTMQMPWEKTGLSDQELKQECHRYLERTMGDSVLEAIPVRLSGAVRAEGVLYITQARTVGVDAPRKVRLYQNRMLLCENAPEVLPKWAAFVNGLLSTPDINPTAARDSFIRDNAATALREALGDLVLRHMETLQRDEPERFSQILRYQNLSIKAACYYYDRFFARFANLLEWRTNGGERDELSGDLKPRWRTLPEILRRLPSNGGEPQRLPCFTTRNSANQYFQMADAAGSIVVDASYPFEAHLIEAYTKLDGVHVRLVHVDREDDPAVFRRLNDAGAEERAIQRLAEAMAFVIDSAGTVRIRVEARHFQPAELAAVVRSDARSRGQAKAEQMLDDPNVPAEIREMAEEMLRMARGESMKVIINANNVLIRRLSRQNLQDPDVIDVMRGVYHNAVLVNQELMSPSNAQLFHAHFQKLMIRNVELLEAKSKLEMAGER